MSIEGFDRVLAAARTGAEWALTTLYKELQPKILRYLAAREPSEAEDLASEVWLDVAAGLDRFEGSEEGFRAWVFTIARRRVLDIRRRAAVRGSAIPSEGIGGDRLVGNVEDEALAAIGSRAALDLIRRLPPAQADVVLLRVLGDLSVSEVAVIVGKRPGAVRVLQHRALRNLRLIILEQGVTG
jgi:RNA polymerase sigma-70 factor (ECF subfamily)